MVNVRPSTRSASSFTLRREGPTTAPRITEASVGAIGAAPAPPPARAGDRDESELALAPASPEARRAARRANAGRHSAGRRLVHHRLVRVPRPRRRHVGARGDRALQRSLAGGQVNLLTTGAFDNPLQLLQLDRTSSVAFFSVGAPVGSHGDWNVRAAMNQSDLSSWMLAGSYVVKAQVPHRYQFGMSYSLQRYEGGNTAALGAVSDTARNVGSVFALRRVASVALRRRGLRRQLRALRLPGRPGALQPAPVARRSRRRKSWRVRAVGVARCQRAGRRGIPSADRRAEYLPPQRTFSPISKAGLPHAGAAELRGRRRARVQRRGDRRARVRAAHRRSDRHGVRPASHRQRRRRRSVTTTSARPAMRVRARRRRHVHARARREHSRLGRLLARRPPTGSIDRRRSNTRC